jgi:hypothetical protein
MSDNKKDKKDINDYAADHRANIGNGFLPGGATSGDVIAYGMPEPPGIPDTKTGSYFSFGPTLSPIPNEVIVCKIDEVFTEKSTDELVLVCETADFSLTVKRDYLNTVLSEQGKAGDVMASGLIGFRFVAGRFDKEWVLYGILE